MKINDIDKSMIREMKEKDGRRELLLMGERHISCSLLRANFFFYGPKRIQRWPSGPSAPVGIIFAHQIIT